MRMYIYKTILRLNADLIQDINNILNTENVSKKLSRIMETEDMVVIIWED